jgi:hypothetical protein
LANSYGVEYFREPTFPRVEATLGSNLRTPLEFNVEERSFGLFVQSSAAMYRERREKMVSTFGTPFAFRLQTVKR